MVHPRTLQIHVRDEKSETRAKYKSRCSAASGDMFSWCASTARVSLKRVLAAMEQARHLKSLTPAELRLLIRHEDPRIRTTTGLAHGKNCNLSK